MANAVPIPVKLDINFSALRNKLTQPLTLAYQRVAAGLAASQRVEVGDLVLPNAMFRLGWAEHAQPSLEWIQDDYRTWILGNGFRDAIEAVHLFLDEVRLVAAVLSLAGGKELKGAEFNKLMSRDQQKFHRLGFPEKFEVLADEWNVSVPEFYRDAALTCNLARNCLVHRGGRVETKDLNCSTALEIRWRRLGLFVNPEVGERELRIGDTLHTGDEVATRHVDMSRRFELGERVLFDPREFSDIAFTLAVIGESVVHQIQERAKGLGIVVPPVG